MMYWTSLYRPHLCPSPKYRDPHPQSLPPACPQTCSNLVHYGKSHSQDLFKFVHYVAHISIGKQAVRLGLKGLLVIQVFFAPEVGNTKELECLVHTLKRKRINPSQLE